MGTTLRRNDPRTATLAALTTLVLAGCGGGGTGSAGPSGPPGPPGSPVVVGPYDPLPGVNLTVLAVTGGSGAGGAALPADVLTVRFKAEMNDGTALDVPSMARGEIYLSGPSNNYQRVLLPQTDVATHSVYAGGGVWTYTFAAPVPALYPPPFNDTAAFGLADGELQGTPLLDGTYTVGLQCGWEYVSDGKTLLDVGTAAFDVLFGSAATIAHREVVANQNCNVCHTQLRAHDDFRRDVRLCVLCHTAGAEDGNVANATPGVTIEFKVMVHRIHNGDHLPSVVGVSTDATGARLYPTGAAGSTSTTVVNFPKRLVFADETGALSDFSDVSFPVFPNFNIAMPKDFGYSALGSATPTVPPGYTGLTLRTQKSCEDTIRFGVTACDKCHGDPDAAGPMAAPAQGGLCYTQPSRQACGSCHDDVDWDKPYTANGQTMPIQGVNGACLVCHTPTGGSLPTKDLHVHPLNDPAVDAGVNCVVTAVTGGSGGSGQFLNGDAPKVTFTLKNDAGADIGLAGLDSCSAFFLGNTVNRQLVMPLTSANGMSLNPFDFTGRLQAVSTTNKGSMSKVFLGAPAVAETLVVQFSSATQFDVTGTVSGPLGSGTLSASTSSLPSGGSIANWALSGVTATEQLTIAFSSATAFTVTGSTSGVLGTGNLPAAKSASMRFTSPKVSFNLTVGTTSFAAGNQFNAVLFKGGAANPVTFVITAGTVAFASTAPAPDRFYYEVVPNASTYTFNVPMDMQLEFLGDGSGAAGQTLTAGNLPVYFGRQQLWEATVSGPTVTMATGVNALARQVDVTPATGFAAGDTVVVDPTGGVGLREYTTITPAKADGTAAGSSDSTARLIFRTPLRYAHGAVTISKVTLALKLEGAGSGYTLNPATGTVTSVTPFTAGRGVVMTYRTTSKFGYFRHAGDVLQAYYVPPANDTVAIGQEQGDWQGLPYLPGTYTADIWFYRNLDVGLQNELQTYRSTSYAGTKDFLYATTGPIVPHAIISTSENCYTCHNDVMFHGGGRRGVDACLTCHSVSGNTSGLVQSSLTASPPVPIEFRQMLHKIHMGVALPGGTATPPYPFANEGTFPAMPGAVAQCARCHGNDAWKQPAPRVHPSAAVAVRVWGDVCGSCHDSTPAATHITLNTPGGVEACDVCHGPSKPLDVVRVHFVR